MDGPEAQFYPPGYAGPPLVPDRTQGLFRRRVTGYLEIEFASRVWNVGHVPCVEVGDQVVVYPSACRTALFVQLEHADHDQRFAPARWVTESHEPVSRKTKAEVFGQHVGRPADRPPISPVAPVNSANLRLEYTVARATSPDRLCQRVDELLLQGWVPCGGVVVTWPAALTEGPDDDAHLWAQAATRYTARPLDTEPGRDPGTAAALSPEAF